MKVYTCSPWSDKGINTLENIHNETENISAQSKNPAHYNVVHRIYYTYMHVFIYLCFIYFFYICSQPYCPH